MKREELEKSLRREEANINARLKLFYLFGDLDVVSSNSRWSDSDLWYTSKSVNAETDPNKIRLSVNRSCGCCFDTPYYATPYITVDGINLYGTPIRCPIGEGLSCGSGIVPYANRFDAYKEHGYSDAIIEKIEKYLADHPPIPCDDDEDDETEQER